MRWARVRTSSCCGAPTRASNVFAEPTFEALVRAINDRAPFLARRRADMLEVVRVDADALELMRQSASLDVEAIADRNLAEHGAAMKTARLAEIRAANAAAD